MIPYTYNMVDMGGIDLAEANHTVVEGIFSKIENALDDTEVLVLYNMYFAKIGIPPCYCNIVVEGGSIYINDSIEVSANDEVTVIAIPPPLEPVIPLSVDDNGVYTISGPQSGYNPVTVSLQFTELSTNENGVYTPQSPSRGFSKVTVEVPQTVPVIESLSVTDNGTYEAPEGVDGYSPVSVNVSSAPSPKEPVNFDVSSGYVAYGSWTYSTSSGSYSDVYEVVADHRYFLCLGQQVGNRFRCMFSTSNPALATSNVSGTSIGVDQNSPPSNAFNPTVYQPSSNGFITVGKSNNNTSGIKSYCWDLTELGISPPTT